MTTRYTVRTNIPPRMAACGIVAYVWDAQHPDDPEEGASLAWFQDATDAERVAYAARGVCDERGRGPDQGRRAGRIPVRASRYQAVMPVTIWH